MRAEDLRGAGYYFDDLLLYPGAALPGERALGRAARGARPQLLRRSRSSCTAAGGLDGVQVRDLLSGQVHARAGRAPSSTARGPGSTGCARWRAWPTGARGCVRTTKGIHCLLPRMTDRAVYLSTRDERMIFVIPWREFSLVGTTDTDFDGDPDRLWATRDEVTYLLDEVAKVLPDKRATFDNVAYTYAGVRPLSFEPGAVRLRGLARPQGDPGGPGRPLPLGHRDQADLLPQPGRGRGRPGDARARPRPGLAHRAAHPRRRRRGGRQDRGARVDGRLRRDGGHRALARYTRDAGGDLRPCLPARARAGAQAARRLRAPVPEQSRDRGPAPPRPPRGAGRLAAGRAAAPHRHRPEPLPGPRLRGVHRARAWPSWAGWSRRRLDAELEAYSQHVERSRRFRQRA